jgi:hypothetical protein
MNSIVPVSKTVSSIVFASCMLENSKSTFTLKPLASCFGAFVSQLKDRFQAFHRDPRARVFIPAAAHPR